MRYGHIQEVIVQNFRAKPGTKMAGAPEPSLDDLLWTARAARDVLGPEMHVQVPPNLSYDEFPRLLEAGIDDWGGISPVTLDHVNPEAPWPEIERLREATEAAGFALAPRLPIYPEYVADLDRWADPRIAQEVRKHADADGLARDDRWAAGVESRPPAPAARPSRSRLDGELDEDAVTRLFQARGPELGAVLAAADELRRETSGDEVTYVVTRNINYTNVCYFRCGFCAFSKGKLAENLRGAPYLVPLDEIVRRCREAWERGAVEVCLQGGIHPAFTGDYYVEIVEAIKRELPDLHVHAFSALEVWQGAATLGLPLADYLARLRDAGLASLPGTAAEILDDEVRRILCPDKVTTEQWLEVHETAHDAGLRSTATIMFGSVEGPRSWARHLIAVRDLQKRTGGFTELVPLPFVHMEAPIYLKGGARPGPTFREAVLMHAVGASGSASVRHEHPDLVGEDGRRGRAGVPPGRSERPRRDAHERVDLARGRRVTRPGDAARGDGGGDPRHRAHAEAADDALRHSSQGTQAALLRSAAARRADQPARERRRAQATPAARAARGDVNACRARGRCSGI